MVGDTTPASKDALIHRQVLRNTASNYIGKILTLGIFFFLTPFILRHLGDTTYGLWTLVASAVGYGALLDFGIAGALTKYVAEYRARGAIASAQSLVATTLWIYMLLGGIAIAISAAAAPFFPDLFNVPAQERATATRLVLLMGINIGLSIPCTTPMAILRGLQRFDLANLLGTAATLLSAAGTVAVILLGGGVVEMVKINIAILLVMQIPILWVINRIAPELRFGRGMASRQLVRTVVSYGSSIFMIQAAGRLQSQTDEMVIGAFLPLSSVTPYAIARKLSELAQTLTDQFMKVLLPLASQLHAEDDHARLRLLYTTSTRLTLAIFLPIAGVVVLLARAILTVWVGGEYADYAYLVAILTLSSLIDTSQWPASSILAGMARHKRLAIIAISTSLMNLALSVVLVQHLGVKGVALGTLIPTIIECFVLIFPYALRTIGVSFYETLREIFLPTLLPLLPTIVVLYELRELVDPASLLPLISVAAIGVMVYAVGYLALGARSFERQILRDMLNKMLRLASTGVKPL